jgi:hypothetical protein
MRGGKLAFTLVAVIAHAGVVHAGVVHVCLAQGAPKNGVDVLTRMHDAYAGKWYHTLTFTQRTTQYRPDGTTNDATWYESLRHTADNGVQLRIDIGAPAAGNGMLYTADSTAVVRAGKLASARAGGNEFLPMIEGVYVQPVAKTVAELKSTGVDLTKVARGSWEGRPVWIVGVTSAADSTVQQFWIDAERNVVVRMILAPAPTTPVMDIHLGKYERLGGGWLATKIDMLVGGKPRQTEQYMGWKADIPLAAGLFDPATWTTAPHWVTP